jgi:hypothetical protein
MARTVPLHLRIEPEIEALLKVEAAAEEIPLATMLARVVRRHALRAPVVPSGHNVCRRDDAPPNTPASTTEPTHS